MDPKEMKDIQLSLSIKIQLLNDLKNASNGLRDYFSTREKDTSSWLLESSEFEWVISNEGQTLLCRGMPGAGKTIMTSVKPRVGIAYTYCNFKDTERQDCHDLLSSLAKQLAQSLSTIPPRLEELYSTHQKRNTFRSKQETIEMLQTIASCYDRVFVVIDALDECERNARLDFLPEVFRLQQVSQVNIFATIRDIPEIIQAAEFANSIAVEIRATEEDVMRYVSGRMTHMQSFVRGNLDMQKEIRKVIVMKVNGMFLLARLLIDAWSNKLNAKKLKEALRAFGSTNEKENAYSAVYDEAMKRVRSQPSEQTEPALKILSWIIGAKRPLKVTELQHALAVEEGHSRLDQDNITPIETMISSGVMRLVHQTTQEYFEGKRHELFPKIDSQIATACVSYLSIDNLDGNSNDSASFDYETQDWEDSTPFLTYATLNWGEHTRASSTVPKGALGFLQNQAMRNRSLSALRRLRRLPFLPCNSAHTAAYYGIAQLFTTSVFPEDEMYSTGENGTTALWWAAYAGHADLVKFYLDIDAIEHPQGRLLLMVVNSGNIAVMEYLLDNKADIEGADINGRTPLSWASQQNWM
ncbi:hypothetical protein BDP81DRAFT_456712 [Colletotrichum phormii]|uniref:Nephrocystin 3-like N-terminal domain-containing protein n=1 Tax=Colletotrichum phormii TaxID=359342 RepID=A0AAJ0A6E5_9PEZI|nr:uncharacterized protein BDP81DRAFT_456712 [Colletotrichum phormii]KAK1655916.1 hypothetical protein BDP81DRAFT_456712 [Colletotrichum phormii]